MKSKSIKKTNQTTTKIAFIFLTLLIILLCTSCTRYVYTDDISSNPYINPSESQNQNEIIDYAPAEGNSDNTYITTNKNENKVKDFINDIKHYAKDGKVSVRNIELGWTKEICGVEYNSCIVLTTTYDGCGENTLYYNLDGKYTTLKLKAYSEGNDNLYFYGDDALLHYEKMEGKALPIEIIVDVTGVKGFRISGKRTSGGSPGDLCIFDATIE